jgi:dihydropteroate synthase
LAELYAIIESRARAQGAALMGVVNTTPDSFFDGGRYATASEAASRVDALLELGTTLIDIGGESTRPGAKSVQAAEQIVRIAPALTHAVARGALVSIDTTDPEVAAFALEKGARVVNDVSCLGNQELARVVARHDAAIVITHSRGPMSKMAGFSQWPQDGYADVVVEVRAEWEAARDRACEAGVRRENVWFDPGFGFSKNARHSFELLRRLEELKASGALLVVGPGRKSFLASADPAPPEDRLGGTVAACVLAVQRGAQLLRVHDVREVRQAVAVLRAASSPAANHSDSEGEAAHAR